MSAHDVARLLLVIVAALCAAPTHATAATADPEVERPATGHTTTHHPVTDGSVVDHSEMEPSTIDHSKMDHSKMDHSQMGPSQMDHSQMDHSQMGPSQMDHSQMGQSQMDHADANHSQMDHSRTVPAHDHASMGHRGSAAGATPLPPLTDADRRAAFPVVGGHATHEDAIHHYLLVDRLETSDRRADGTPLAWEIEGWLGTDTERLWLRSEGERSGGRTHAADLELLYGRSVTAWWDVVAGVRHEFLPADARSWAAIGVQGLAPQMFEVQATAYLGEGGRTRASIEVEHELLLSNRWILQPVLEATWHGQDDAARGIGSGLSTVEAGLRLRYEVTRRFAPYVGIAHARAFGDTAALRRDAAEHRAETRVVAGVRVWF